MRKMKRKHNKIVLAAMIKLNSIENIISKILIDFEISHEELKITKRRKNVN